MEDLESKLANLELNKDQFDVFQKNQELTDGIKAILYKRKRDIIKEKNDKISIKYNQDLERVEELDQEYERAEAEKQICERKVKNIKREIDDNHKMERQKEKLNIEENNMKRQLERKRNDNLMCYEEYQQITQSFEEELKRLKKLYDKKIMLSNLEMKLKTQLIIINQIQTGVPNLSIGKKDISELKKKIKSFENEGKVKEEELADLYKKDKEIANEIYEIDQSLNQDYDNIKEIQSNTENLHKSMLDMENKRNRLNFQLKEAEDELMYILSGKGRSVKGHNKNNSFYGIKSLIDIYKHRRGDKFISMVIDTVQIPNDLIDAYESLHTKKLFSVIVQDETEAAELIKINNELKKGGITIYCLSDYLEPRELKNNYEPDKDNEEVISLLSYLNLSPEMATEESIQRNNLSINEINRDVSATFNFGNITISIDPLCNLLKYLFNDSYLVKNRSLAAKIAEKYDVNTVTVEGDVFYAGAFLQKIGYHKHNQSIRNYYRLLQAHINVNRIKREIRSIEETKRKEYKEYEKSSNQLNQIENRTTDKETHLRILKEDGKEIKIRLLKAENIVLELEVHCNQQKQILEEKEQARRNPQKYYDDNSNMAEISLRLEETRNLLLNLTKKIKRCKLTENSDKFVAQFMNNLKNSLIMNLSQNQMHIEPDTSLKAAKDEYYAISLKVQEIEQEKERLSKFHELQKEKIKNNEKELSRLEYKLKKLDYIEEPEEYDEMSSKNLLKELKALSIKKPNLTEKDVIVFKKMDILDKKRKGYDKQIKEIDNSKELMEEFFSKLIRKDR